MDSLRTGTRMRLVLLGALRQAWHNNLPAIEKPAGGGLQEGCEKGRTWRPFLEITLYFQDTKFEE
jgi:hypothetical protein